MYNKVWFLRRLARKKVSLSNLYCFTYNKLQERVDDSARFLNLLTICHVICYLSFVMSFVLCNKPMANN